MVVNLKTYLALAKPGIVMGNVITCAGGFAFAVQTHFPFPLFFMTLLGLSLIVASGCVSNNYIDRHHDKKMARTQNRPLPKGLISPKQALYFAIALFFSGLVVLFFIDLLALLFSLFGFIVYLIFYSFSKYRTVHATLIGSIAGAVPPVVGYCAVSHQFNGGALLIFLMIALWQMPHFYAIAMYRLEDYVSASIPVLPAIKGVHTTKMHMLLYILGFLVVALLLPLLGYVGSLYLIAIALLGAIWLILCLQGFKCSSDQRWAHKMFLCSLAVVIGVCLMIACPL